MGAKNAVVAGEYQGKLIKEMMGVLYVTNGLSTKKWIPITKETIETFEEIGVEESSLAGSAVTRGLVGAALLGPIGLAAAATARKKGIHTIALRFSDGKESLIEIDDKRYKVLQYSMF